MTRLATALIAASATLIAAPSIAIASTPANIGPIANRSDYYAALPLPPELGEIPNLEKTPLYIWEWHIWHQTPFGPGGRHGYYHGGDNALSDTESAGPDWMRNRHPVGYPLTGPYSSENPEVIRWQLRCMKATGVDGVFVHLYPEWNRGDFFVWEPTFARILDIAAEEGVKIGIHDEVQFRRGTPAQQPEVMTRRLTNLLRKYASHPGILRIDGKPAVTFAYWNYFEGRMPPDKLAPVLRAVEEAVGEKVFWAVGRAAGARTSILDVPEVSGIIPISNSNTQIIDVLPGADSVQKSNFGRKLIPGYVDQKPFPPVIAPAQIADFKAARAAYPDKWFCLWGYPGFENSTGHGGRRDVVTGWLPRRKGLTLVELLRTFAELTPSAIVLTSWNDWEENTALEPGIDYDGYAGDPYLYCRILAAAKGRTFIPPPLPPKEALDPWMWQPLFGIDKRAPEVLRTRYSPLEPAVVATVVDSASAVRDARLLPHGDAWLSVGKEDSFTGSGIAAIKPLNLHPDGGLLVRPGETVEIALQSGALAKSAKTTPDESLDGEEFFVAVEFAHTAPGKLRIYYPAQTYLVDYKPTDEQKFRVQSEIATTSTGNWAAAMRRMRGFKLSPNDQSAAPLIQLHFQPANRQNPSPEPLRISRVHLFRSLAGGIPGTEISFAAETSSVKVYRFSSPNLATDIPTAAYLIATDAQGNQSAPIPVTP